MIVRLFAIVLTLALLGTSAAQPIAEPIYLPLVSTTTGQPAHTEITVLVGGDNSEISAAVLPGGCRVVSYIRRDHGNLLSVGIDRGTFVEDIALPQPIIIHDDVQTGFVPPGAKHASSSLLVVGNTLYLYYTTRPDGAISGPFMLVRLSMPAPEC